MTLVAERQILLPYPHPGQQIVRREARRFNWLSAGRRWRKTTLAMSISIEEAIKGKCVIWCAPVFDQVRVSWAETLRSAVGVAEFNMSRMVATFPGGGMIIYRSLDNPNNVRGHTADGVVVDEAPMVKPEAWHEVLRPMLIDTNGWAWLIGTPYGHNWYWREFQDAASRDDSAAWNAPTLGVRIEDGYLLREPHPLENPNIPFSEMVDLYNTTPENTFRQEIMASFMATGAVVWLREWCEERYDPTDASMEGLVWSRFLSYDTASKDKVSNAYSACVVGEMLYPGRRLRIRHVWRERLLMPDLVDHIEKDAERWNYDGKLDQIIIEDRASGIGAYQTLMKSGSERIQRSLNAFNPTTSKEERFGNAGVWVKNGSVILPTPHESTRWLHAFESEVFEEDEFLDQRDAVAQLILWLENELAQGLSERSSRRAA